MVSSANDVTATCPQIYPFFMHAAVSSVATKPKSVTEITYCFVIKESPSIIQLVLCLNGQSQSESYVGYSYKKIPCLSQNENALKEVVTHAFCWRFE